MQPTNNNQMISYHRMRMIVGILGVFLPFGLLLGNLIINNFDLLNNDLLIKNCHPYLANGSFKPSISDYYYTAVGELFVGTLCAVSFFMFSYKGYAKKSGEFWPSDNFMVNLAGICGMGVAIFPTTTDCTLSDNLRTFISSDKINIVHYAFAVLFFVSLAIISLVNFRRTSTVALFGKMPSHNFYRNCGIGILVSLIILTLYKIKLHEIEALKNIPVVFIFETTALLFFGASWIKKGRIDSN